MNNEIGLDFLRSSKERLGVDYKVVSTEDWFSRHYPNKTFGEAALRHSILKKGIYFAEGVRGYHYYYVQKPVRIIELTIKGETWMVSDWLHYSGMEDLAAASKGRVLVAGLGLGMLTKFLMMNPKVDAVTTVERSSDVSGLVYPQLSLWNNVRSRLIKADFYKYVEENRDTYDTIILDLWVIGENATSEERSAVYHDVVKAVAICECYHPEAKLYVWGSRNRKYNPAVTIDDAIKVLG